MNRKVRRALKKSSGVVLAGTMMFSNSGVMALADTSKEQPTVTQITEMSLNQIQEEQEQVVENVLSEEVYSDSATNSEDIENDTVSGTWGTCEWTINSDGVLTIGEGVGKETEYGYSGTHYGRISPWTEYKNKIKKIDITGNITFDEDVSLEGLFISFNEVTEINGLKNIDFSKVTDISHMFMNCSSLTNLDIGNWDVSNVTDAGFMFYNCSGLVNLEIGDWNVSSMTCAEYMFSNCSSLTHLDLSSFDLSSLFFYMDIFDYCDELKEVTMPKNWGVRKDGIISEFKSCMARTKVTSWTDIATGDVYEGLPNTLIEGHKYVETKLQLTVSSDFTTVTSGNDITISTLLINSSSSENYTYKFIVYDIDTKQWTKLQDFSSSSSYTWKTTDAGNKQIYVDVKDSKGNVTRSQAVNVKVEETTKPLAISATKQEADKTVTFTANGTGGSGKYSYKFIVYNKTTNSWAKLQDFSEKNTFTWTKGNAGDRYFYVDVKDNTTGKTVRSQALNVKIDATSTPTSTLTASTANVNVGGKVTLTAKATAGSGKYTYKFLIYNPATKQWAKLQDFSNNSTFTWTAGSAGARQFYVDVKDSNGKVTRSKVVNVQVGNAQSVTKLSVKATASTTANKVGQNVTFTATANGGAGGYTYKFLVYNKTTKQWAKIQDFSATSKLTWKAGSAGERQFYVDVKDKNGNTVRSSVMNVKTTK